MCAAYIERYIWQYFRDINFCERYEGSQRCSARPERRGEKPGNELRDSTIRTRGEATGFIIVVMTSCLRLGLSDYDCLIHSSYYKYMD